MKLRWLRVASPRTIINKACLFGEQASSDNDNRRTYDPEQVTRCRLNAYYSNHTNSGDCKGDSGGEKVKNNYVCTASSLGRYEERNLDNTEPATDSRNTNTDTRNTNTYTHNTNTDTRNTNTDNRAITKDQIRELINQLENLTFNQKQKLTAVLLKHQGHFTNKPGTCRGFQYTFQVKVNCQSLLIHALYHFHCDQTLARNYGN